VHWFLQCFQVSFPICLKQRHKIKHKKRPRWDRVESKTGSGHAKCLTHVLQPGWKVRWHFSRAATNDYLIIDCFLDLLISCLVHKMSENGEKYQSLFPKTQCDVLKCLTLSFTVIAGKEIRKYSHMRSWNQRIWEKFFLKNDSKLLIIYQNSLWLI